MNWRNPVTALGCVLLADAGAGQPQEQRGRDPFRPPRAVEEAARPPGLAGVRIREAVIRGVLRLVGAPPEEAFAVLESPSGEVFLGRPGDRLLDGSLHRVESDGVRFLRDGEPQREVFRALADGNE